MANTQPLKFKLPVKGSLKSLIINKDTLSDGWIKRYLGSGNDSVASEGGEKQYSKSQGVTFWRNSQMNRMSPGELYGAVADPSAYLQSNAPLNGAVASTGSAYFILDNARLILLSLGTGGTISDYYDVAFDTTHSGHTTPSGEDILLIKAADGNEYILWSWNDNTDGDISLTGTGANFKNAAHTNFNWFSGLTASGVLIKGVPHKMLYKTIFNDLYVTNGQYIGTVQLSGTATPPGGTGNPTRLNLGQGWIASSICDYGSYIAVVGYQKAGYYAGYSEGVSRTVSRMWLWDGYSDNPNYVFDIPDNYVARIINDNGTLKVFTQGRNATTKIIQFNGYGFDTINEYASNSIGTVPYHYGIDIYQDMINWIVSSGIYCLSGAAIHCRQVVQDVLFNPFSVTPTLLKNLYGDRFYVGGAGKLWIMNYNYLKSSLTTRIFQIPRNSTITKIVVRFSQFGSGASVKLGLFNSYGSGTIGFSDDLLNLQISSDNFGTNIISATQTMMIPDIDNFFMVINWNHASSGSLAAIISDIEIYYELTDTQI